MSSETLPPILSFEGFYLDPRQRLLFRADGESLPLPSRAFDTLLYLARNPHQLVDKQQLMKAVWPHTIVEENNLSQHISLLRRVLGEVPGQHRFIVTVPGRGFRFVPVVTELQELPSAGQMQAVADVPAGEPGSAAGAASRPSALNRRHGRSAGLALGFLAATVVAVAGAFALLRHPGKVAAEPSLVVLPFADLSPAGDQAYLSEGLAEELINQLAQIPQLRVIARTSAFQVGGQGRDARRIGEVLGVNHILEGSVRKSDQRIRVTVKLIDPADGAQIWSDTYDREVKDVIALQEEIAHSVATQLHLKLDSEDLPAGGTRDVRAYEEFLTGRMMLNSNDEATILGAASHFERALRIDPAFMAARLWLIDACLRTTLASVELKDAALRRQDEAIDEVTARAPGTPEASFALSYRAARGRDLVGLERLLMEAMQSRGSAGERARMRYGQFLLSSGRVAAARRELEAVVLDDPLNDFIRTQALLLREIADRPEEGQREVERFLRTPGGNSQAIHGVAIRMAQGQRDPAVLARAIEVAEASGNMPLDSIRLLRQMVDAPVVARQQLRQRASESGLIGNVFFASSIAMDAAYLGDHELALQGLRAMADSGFTFETTAFVLWRPVMRPLRSDPAFKALVRQLGLEDYWRRTGNWGDFCKPAGDQDLVCQ